MKTKKIMLVVIVAVIALVAALAAWYLAPKSFLKGVDPGEIGHISVFDGNTGEQFDISSEDEISFFAENISGLKMKKSGLSLGKVGYGFKVSVYDGSGKELDSFIINSADTVRSDPFFYRCDGGLCYDYLKGLEEKYSA